jgi:pyridoxamine 5'-phosphate oxidase
MDNMNNAAYILPMTLEQDNWTPPPFYNDLELSRQKAFHLLKRGVKDRRSGYHLYQIATLTAEGLPTVRSVVNRHFDPDYRSLRFHTDVRGRKVDELRACPDICVHSYDPRPNIQIRLFGRAQLHEKDVLRQKAWEATRHFSRECYRMVPPPGSVLPDPVSAEPPTASYDDEGFDNFIPVSVIFDRFEWLYLCHKGHRRAEFVWKDEHWQGQWLAP